MSSSKRTILLVLVIFVCLTTAVMVLLSQDFMIHMQHFAHLISVNVSLWYENDTIANYSTRLKTTEQSRPQEDEAGLGPSGSAESDRPIIDTRLASTTARPVTPTPTDRPMMCADCFYSNFTILIENTHVCEFTKGTGVTPEMIVIITSAPQDVLRRQAIRDTWISVTKRNTAHIRHIFLLGTLAGEVKVSLNISTEAHKYQDLVVADFVDSYGNLTLKTMVGLRWIVDHCNIAKFFIKTDHDMYVMVQRVLDLARAEEAVLTTSLGGQCYQTARPWRDPKTKYYASLHSYPQPNYPGFCSGTGYVSTLNVARKVVQTSPNIPFFHLEDVYLTLVLRHIGYKLTTYPGFVMGANACDSQQSKASVKTIHEIGPEKIRELWTKCGV